MRDFKLNKFFDLIIIPFNSLLHLLTNNEISDCFASVLSHLSDDGYFILDIFVPDPELLYRTPNKKYQEMVIDHPKGGKCLVWQESKYDQETEINDIKWLFDRNDNRTDEYQFQMRMIYPDTIDRLLFEAGFTIEQKLGDYNSKSFNENSLLQIYICSKQ